MSFPREARLLNLRLHCIRGVKTSSRVVLVLDSESWLALQAKRGKVKLQFLTVSLANREFFANDFKYRYIIYRWKVFFFVINNSRSLPQNKALA